MINPPLNVGDRVRCLHMDDEYSSVPPGSMGTVINVGKTPWGVQYMVEWDNGSKLALLSDADVWDTGEKKSKVSESIESEKSRHDNLIKNMDVLTHFKHRFLKEYLIKLRDCGVTNMLASAPYLYMGRERMELDFRYHNVENEICDEVLDLADKIGRAHV